MKKEKIHYKRNVCYSVCGAFLVTQTKKKNIVTCKNCKRTEAFKNKKWW